MSQLDNDPVRNTSANRHISEVLEINLQRRRLLQGGMGAAALAFFGWEYTDIAFERQRELSREKLLLWANELSLDAGRFEQCVASDSKRSLVLAEYKEGLRRGVEGTPTFFVNGEKVQGKLPALQQAIEAGLAAAGEAP